MKTTLREKPSKQNFTVLHVIGKGGFGKVWKVKDHKNDQEFAMKEMSKALYKYFNVESSLRRVKIQSLMKDNY